MSKPKPYSLLNKKYCETCDKDISASYFSKHLKSKTHLEKAENSNVPSDMAEPEFSAELSSSDDEVSDLKFDKVPFSESEEEEEVVEQGAELSPDESNDLSASLSESESEEEQPLPEPEELSNSETDEPLYSSEDESSPEPVKKNVKVQFNKANQGRGSKKAVKNDVKKKYRGIYEVSSSESEDEQPEVYGSGFIKFVRELDYSFGVSDPAVIKEIFNDVMGFKPSKKYYINSTNKKKLRRYLDKFQDDNEAVDQDLVNTFMLDFLNEM